MGERERKVSHLKEVLSECESLVIAYSGGVDSTYLLSMALRVLGSEKVLAVVAYSPTYPMEEAKGALQTAQSLGARLRIIATEEFTDENFASNPQNRCYYCKMELFSKLLNIARQEGYRWVADGSNYDDLADYRPGRQAKEELGIRSPSVEAELRKDEIRLLSKELGLPTWDKPSFACLSTRFPYGDRITVEKLRMVDAAEGYLRELGFRQLRVRIHNNVARIELGREELPRIFEEELMSPVVQRLKEIGFKYVTLDLEGYRTGSMNEVLDEASKAPLKVVGKSWKR